MGTPWQSDRSEHVQEKDGWETGRHLLKGRLFPSSKKKKNLVFLHGFFLFQNKQDSQSRVGKWSSHGLEQLILVVHTVVGSLESVSLSHAWGLRLRWHFQLSGFSWMYVTNVLHQNTRALLFRCDLMLMRGRIVHKVIYHLQPRASQQVTWAMGECHRHLVAFFPKHTSLLWTVWIVQTWKEMKFSRSKKTKQSTILKDDAVKVLHSICQQIWKAQQWPQDWKRTVFIPIPKKGNAEECSHYSTVALISHISKVMLKILQARLQQYVNQELPDVQAGYRKGRGPDIKLPTSTGT